MPRSIKWDGDRWRPRLGERSPLGERQTVVFFCESNGQRPYRVVTVSTDRVSTEEDLERLSEEELAALLSASHSLGSPAGSG